VTTVRIVAAVSLLAGLVLIVAAAWRWLSKGARLVNEYFLAAATSYFLFDDPHARLAAVVAGLTNAGEARDAVVAVLMAIEQMPDTMALLFIAAAPTNDPVLSGTSVQDLARIIRMRAGHVRSDMARSADTSLVTLRQQLFQKRPEYEHALGGVTKVNPHVFSRLRAEGFQRIVAMYTLKSA
jgi:hypothetical protein